MSPAQQHDESPDDEPRPRSRSEPGGTDITRDATRLGIGIVGAGRVGAVLGSALRATGHAIVAASAVSTASRDRVELLLPGVPILDVPEIVERSELVLLTVPDDVLPGLVSGLAATGSFQAGQIVVHTAGRHGVEVLSPAARLGAIPLAIHPAMTFSGTSLDLRHLVGCPFVVTARTGVLPIAQALVVEMGGEPRTIAEEDRMAYHAALSHGSNHLVTLVAEARQMLRGLGIEDPGALLGPLLRASLEGALDRGDRALTGPIARGDVETVRAHLETIDRAVVAGSSADDERTSDLSDTRFAYAAMARATVLRAVREGRLDLTTGSELLGVLGDGR